MAFVYISEAPSLRVFQGNAVPAVEAPFLAQQRVVNTGASTQSSAFNAGTKVIRVHADSICSIAINANPTATTSSLRLAAGSTEFFSVNPGDKLAAILNT